MIILGSDSLKIIQFNNVLNYVNKTKYFKKYYISDFVFRLRLFTLTLKYPSLIKECSNSLYHKVMWQAFYEIFQIKNNISMMVVDDLTAMMMHKKNKVKTILHIFHQQKGLLIRKLILIKVIILNFHTCSMIV